MNQLHQSGSFTNSASAPPKPSSPTFNGYARFAKLNIPQLSDSTFIKPPHMQDPSYVAAHAAKPQIASKFISLNDLEEPIKLTVLSDIERDQRLEAFKESIKRSSEQMHANQGEVERKRKADQESFDRFVKKSSEKLSGLQIKYNELHDRHTSLQNKYGKSLEQNQDLSIKIEGYVFENDRLNTLITMKEQEIAGLKETVELFTPQSPPDVHALFNIMESPELDRKRSADDVHEFLDYSYSENPLIDFNQDDEPANHYPSDQLAQTQPAMQQRLYTKKASVVVTDPKVLRALRQLNDDVYNYSRNQFRGVDINGVRYAFYFGKISTGGVIGMSTNIILSSDKKVYNVSDINNPIEMNWNQDRNSKGKRGFGHIYLGKLTGEKGFEAYLKDPFMTELGVMI